MYEIEQKYKISGPSKLRAVLKKMKAVKIRSGAEVNILYDRQGELVDRRSVLRLRHWGGREGVLTFKGPRLSGPFKRRIEIETAVEFRAAEKILDFLGYKSAGVYKKKREEYRLGKAHVTLDWLPGAGWFAEIEASPAGIDRLEKKLGLTGCREERTYLEIAGLPPRISRKVD